MDQSLLGTRISKARNSADMSVADFAKKIGVKPSTVEKWESGELSPRANRIQMIASILNVPIIWLLAGGENIPEPDDDIDLYQIIDEKIRVLELKVDEISALVADLRVLSNDAMAMDYE